MAGPFSLGDPGMYKVKKASHLQTSTVLRFLKVSSTMFQKTKTKPKPKPNPNLLPKGAFGTATEKETEREEEVRNEFHSLTGSVVRQ